MHCMTIEDVLPQIHTLSAAKQHTLSNLLVPERDSLPGGVSLDKLKTSKLWETPISPEGRSDLSRYIEEGRDAIGRI